MIVIISFSPSSAARAGEGAGGDKVEPQPPTGVLVPPEEANEITGGRTPTCTHADTHTQLPGRRRRRSRVTSTCG